MDIQYNESKKKNWLIADGEFSVHAQNNENEASIYDI